MVIDTHVRPALFAPICQDASAFHKRCDEMNYHLMRPVSIELLKKQYALADIAHVFLLPEDCSAETGTASISNEDIAKLVDCDPNFFWGFASVDPRKEDAAKTLRAVLSTPGFVGLYLNTARLQLYPDDPKLEPLYEICMELDKPIVFQAGLCLERDALSKYCRPVDFESIVHRYPSVNMCLAHVGWPWVQETAALMLKYPNLYANTALMNFDGPQQIYHKVFLEDMGPLWVEHNLSEQLMFGSGTPRIRPVRSKSGLDSLGFSSETMRNICYRNALRFLKREDLQ